MRNKISRGAASDATDEWECGIEPQPDDGGMALIHNTYYVTTLFQVLCIRANKAP